jgi:hypothetical protein
MVFIEISSADFFSAWRSRMACSRSRMSRSLLVVLLALTTGISTQICVIRDCGEDCDQLWFQVHQPGTLLERRVSSSSISGCRRTYAIARFHARQM